MQWVIDQYKNQLAIQQFVCMSVIDSYVLEQPCLVEEPLPLRKLYRCHHKDTQQKFLIKLWISKPNDPINYRPLLDNQLSVLKKLQGSPISRFLPKLVKINAEAGLTSPIGSFIVAYQIFESIKYRSIADYRKLKKHEALCKHLLRQIIQFVIELNTDHGMTLSYLNPCHILVDAQLRPRFTHLLFAKPLSYAATFDQHTNFNFQFAFRSPQMLTHQKPFNSQRVDSFQLGVLCCYFMCGGAVCSLTRNSLQDQLYSKIYNQRYPEFWKVLKASHLPEEFKDMVIALICPYQQMRIDPFVIKNMPWWSLPFVPPAPDILDVIQAQEKAQKQAQLLQMKDKAVASRTKVHVVNPRGGILFHRSLQKSEQDLFPPVFEGTNFLDCFFCSKSIGRTYKILKQKCHQHLRLIEEDPRQYQVIAESDWAGNVFRLSARCYVLPNVQDITVVQVKMISGSRIYCQERFNSIATYLESIETDEENSPQ